MKILGLHGGFTVNQHDPAACVVVDGVLKISIEEERISRVKSPRGQMPTKAISYCLKNIAVNINEIDIIAISGATYGNEFVIRVKEYIEHWFGYCPELRLMNHQHAHIYSSLPFLEGSVDTKDICFISSDAYGDRLSSSICTMSNKGKIVTHHKNDSQNSLGMIYSMFTSLCGFRPSLDEYKMMGLAPYALEYQLEDLNRVKEELSNSLDINMENGYLINNSLINSDIPNTDVPFYNINNNILSKIRRLPSTKFDKNSKLLAAAAQELFEEGLLSYLELAYKLTGKKDFVLTGGAALNCAATIKLRSKEFVDSLQITPSSGDRGLAIGSAVGASLLKDCKEITRTTPYLGGEFTETDVIEQLEILQINYERINCIEQTIAELIHKGSVIGWFQGRSEVGARALGNRSILASPLIKDMKSIVNKKIKFREGFRPFAPSITSEDCEKYFEDCTNNASPYMSQVYRVKERFKNLFPSITHVDGTARVQTVDKLMNPKYHKLLQEINKISGFPIVLNTSFNVADMPIVETPREAISVFYSTGMDFLAIGSILLSKKGSD